LIIGVSNLTHDLMCPIYPLRPEHKRHYNVKNGFLNENKNRHYIAKGQTLSCSSIVIRFDISISAAPNSVEAFAVWIAKCKSHTELLVYTRKLPWVYPNPHDASPNRASTLYGPSFLRGVSLSRLYCLFARPVHTLAAAMGRSCSGSFYRAEIVCRFLGMIRAVLARNRAVIVPNAPI